MVNVFLYEFKKLILKTPVGFLLLCFFLLHLIHLSSDYDVIKYQELPSTQTQLENLYNCYGGEITPKTSLEVTKIREEIDFATRQQQQAFSQYDNRQISLYELEEILSQTTNKTKGRSAFALFFNHYTYCSEKPVSRFLVNPQGWEFLLNTNNTGFYLIILCVVFVAMITNLDLPTHKKNMLRCTYRGDISILVAKWLVASTIAVFITIVTQFFAFLKAYIYLPLGNFSAPLQSIPEFASCPFRLSLINAFVVGSMLKAFGLLYVCSLCVSFAYMIQNTILGTTLSMGFIFIPYFLMQTDQKYLLFPSPIGFVEGYKYLQGTIGEIALSPQILIFILSGACLIIALCGCLAYCKLRATLLWRRKYETDD